MAKLKMATLPLASPRIAVSKVRDAIYGTPEFRRWAAAVKQRDGQACRACGASGDGVTLIADHVVEIRDGGAPFDLGNGRTLCARCHGLKTAATRRERYG